MPQLLHAALDRLAERHPAGVRRAARILVSGTRSVPLAEFAAYCVAGPRAAARPRGSADVPDARPRLRVGRVCAGGGIGLGPAAKRHVTAAGADAALWTSDHAHAFLPSFSLTEKSTFNRLVRKDQLKQAT